MFDNNLISLINALQFSDFLNYDFFYFLNFLCTLHDFQFHTFNIINFSPKNHQNIIWKQKVKSEFLYFFMFQDEYNLNPGLEWEDEFTGRSLRNAQKMGKRYSRSINILRSWFLSFKCWLVFFLCFREVLGLACPKNAFLVEVSNFCLAFSKYSLLSAGSRNLLHCIFRPN